MNDIRKDTYYIHSFDVDFSSKVSLCTVCNLFQESAWRHATEHKLGYHDLIKSQKAWVLSSLKINIRALPAWKDNITLYTWARTTDKLFAYRDFEIYSEGTDEPEIRATSSWLIIDVQSKRPQRIHQYAGLMPLLSDKQALDNSLDKIPAVEEIHDSYKKVPAYSDLDVNHHVNNVKYVEWILDLFTMEYQKKHRIRDFEIEYRNEVGYKEVVKLEGQRNNTPESFLVQGVNSSSDKCAFRALINWEAY
jgi:acyl-ACP thioesterase